MPLAKVNHYYNTPPQDVAPQEEAPAKEPGSTQSPQGSPQSPRRTKEVFWQLSHQQRKLLDPAVPVVEGGVCRGVPYHQTDPAVRHMLDHLKQKRRKRCFWMTGAVIAFVGLLCISSFANKRTPKRAPMMHPDVPVTMGHHSSRHLDSSLAYGDDLSSFTNKKEWDRKKRMAALAAAYGLGAKEEWRYEFPANADCDEECQKFMEEDFVKDWDSFYHQRVVLPFFFSFLLLAIGTVLVVQLMRAD